MVGLYKDPNGESITTTFVTSTQKENSDVGQNADGENVIRKLRQRVIELENTLQQVSSKYISICIIYRILYITNLIGIGSKWKVEGVIVCSLAFPP